MKHRLIVSTLAASLSSACAFFGGGGSGDGDFDGFDGFDDFDDLDDFDGAQGEGEGELVPAEGEGELVPAEGEGEGGEGEGGEGEGGNCRLRSRPTEQHYEYLCDLEGEVIEVYASDRGRFFRNRYASVDSVSMDFQSLFPPHGEITHYRVDQNVTSPLDLFIEREWVTVHLCDYELTCPPHVPGGTISDAQRLIESTADYKIYEGIDCGSFIYPNVDTRTFMLYPDGEIENLDQQRHTDRSVCPDVDDVKAFAAVVFPGVDMSMARIQASPAYQLLLADQ